MGPVVIVVIPSYFDDGSKDNTVEVIQATADPEVKLYLQPRNIDGNAAPKRANTRLRLSL